MKSLSKISVYLLVLILLNGCIIISFYPIYFTSDLFENDLLTGKWYESDDDFTWNFIHPTRKQKDSTFIDTKGYELKLYNENDSTDGSVLDVNILNIDGNYYLDFFIKEYGPGIVERDQFIIADLHMLPVHSFARIEFNEDSVNIRWFSYDWLEENLKEKKVKIRHENNGNHILLTASTAKLQKFARKYGNVEDAYDMEINLARLKD